MNGVRIYVGNDINNTDIILNGEAIDLFKDENIQINLKQTDIRDIAQNYNDFTQSFTVPATPKNIRLFRYWHDYNNDYQWEGDLPCRIDIGGVFFKKGTIKVNKGQEDDNGRIKYYQIEFKANLKALKDKFDDTKIEQLDYTNVLPQIEFDYTDSFVYSKIVATSSQWIGFPLISTSRLIDDWNTVKYVNSSTQTGFNKAELRPAIKLRYVFDAIEDTYDVKFKGGFYDVNSPLDNMYIWCNKNSDVVTNVAQIVDLNGTVTGTSSTSISFHTTDPNPLNDYVSITRYTNNVLQMGVDFRLYVSTPTIPYKLFIQKVVLNGDGTVNEIATNNQDNGGYVASNNAYITGNKKVTFGFNCNYIPIGGKESFRFAVESVGSLVVTSFKVIASSYLFISGVTTAQKTLTSSSGFTMIPKFNVVNSLPEISVYDFYISIIKMFNLVVIPISDPITLSQLQVSDAYQLEYYKDYYGKIDEVDLTKYTNRAVTINRINKYKKIEFKHADSSYGTNILYKKAQTPTREYGSLVYKPTFKTDDGEYKIETKLNTLIWRQLPNTYDNDDSYTLKETYLIADGLDEQFDGGVFNKPTIFFSNGISQFTNSTKNLGFVRESLITASFSNYNMFSNVDVLDELNYNTSLTFSRENEFQSALSFYTDKNLFSNNYSDLITGIYSPYSREYEFSAVLPKHIYTNLNLGSQIIIRNQRYSISDITLNLINGQTKLKLNNVIEESNIIETNASSSSFNIETISNIFYSGGDFTEKEIKINYPINTDSLKWRADYSIGTTASGYKVSLTSVPATGFGGLFWYDFYEVSSAIGNHTTTINQFIPVGTYTYDTASSYTNPITCYMRAKTNNSLTLTVIAYDVTGSVIAQSSVTV